jgi:hypothetical protein
MPMTGWAVDVVARVPARVQVKLLAAFLAIAMLLIMLGTVGLDPHRRQFAVLSDREFG